MWNKSTGPNSLDSRHGLGDCRILWKPLFVQICTYYQTEISAPRCLERQMLSHMSLRTNFKVRYKWIGCKVKVCKRLLRCNFYLCDCSHFVFHECKLVSNPDLIQNLTLASQIWDKGMGCSQSVYKGILHSTKLFLLPCSSISTLDFV